MPLTEYDRRMGGFAAAEALGPDGRSERGRQGGEAVLEKYGASHFRKLAYMKAQKQAQKKEKARR